MKRQISLKTGFVGLIVIILSLAIVTTVHAATMYYRKYPGDNTILTTVSYNNSITDSSGVGWNAQFYDSPEFIICPNF